MSSSTPTPTTSTKEAAKDGVNSVNGQEASASSEEVVVKKDASKLAVIAPRRMPSEEGHSPRLVIASPSATPSPRPVGSSNSLRPSPVAPSPRVSPKPVAVTASLRPSPVAASPRVSPKPETALLAPKSVAASPRLSPKPVATSSSSPRPSPKPSTASAPSSATLIVPSDSSDSSTSPKVTAPKTLPILSLPASTSPPSPSKSPGIASAPTPSNTGAPSQPELSKLLPETSSSAPATPKLTALLSGTPTATVAPTSSSSSAPGPVKLAKLAVNGRRVKEKKAPVTATMATLPPGVQIKPALPFGGPGMMGQPMFYRAPGSNQLVQFIQQPSPAMLQQLQRLRGEAPTTSSAPTATMAVAPAPARPAGPVPIAPRPANLSSTSTAPPNNNAKIAPKKPSGPPNIRPRPIEKRPIAPSQPGPSTSTLMSNPPIVSFQRAPNNVMFYPQGVRFAAAPMQGTPVSGAPTMMNQAFRMVGHPGAAGIFPAQMPPGAMMSPGGYMPYPFMSYMGGAPQFVHMPTMIPTASVQSGMPQGIQVTVSTSAPTLTAQGPSVAQTAAAVNPDEDENDPPPPLLEPDQANMESPPPPRRADAIATAEAVIATTSAPPVSPRPSQFATVRAKEVNDAFWKQATAFRKLRRSRQVKLNGPMKHVLKNNVVEEKPNPFTPIKTPADRLAELRDQKKATKRTPQRPPSPEATEDDEPEQEVEPSPPARRGRKKKLSLPVKAVVKVEPKKLRTTTPKKLQNGTRSAPTSRRSARSVSSQRSSRYSEATSKNTPTSSKTKKGRRSSARKGRAGEIEKLIAMDFGSGKSPFQTTDVSEYVKKVKKESTLLRPAVVHSYTEHDDYDEDDEEEEEEDDYDSMMTEETPDCEEESTASPNRSEDEEDDEEEACLGCSKPFKGGLRSERYPQYCTKACRAEFRDARKQNRKRQSGAAATSSSSVSREAGGLDELPEQPNDADEGESEPAAKVRRLSEDEVEPTAPTPSLPPVQEPTMDNSPPPPPRPSNHPGVTPTPPSTEPTDPVATTPTSSGAPPTSNTSPVNEHQKALDTACLSAANVHDWTADDVAIWVNVVTNSSTNGDAFRAEEIDGSSLLMLNSEHLKDALKFKLGPALKLRKAIDWLRNTSET